MKILHLSDLHLTGENQRFDDVWHGPRAQLAQGTFDLVIVSGDLSQRAAPAEYDQLRVFIDLHVVPLLRAEHGASRARVVMVPGNHDVDWTADIGERVSLSDLADARGGAELAHQLRALRRHPDRSPWRQVLSSLGHLEFLRIDPKKYPSRFANVGRFLQGFYAGLDDGVRCFDLGAELADQWSAHVFHAQRVVVCGFNSCVSNDRYWHGASLHASAVNAARAYADARCQGYLRVAVWHHGLTSEQGRPDALSMRDIGLLYNNGFRVGFHGHTHRATAQVFDDFLRDRFVLVSTGSLGAGSQERPDAVGNQFSVAHVYPGQVDVQVFERESDHGEYLPRHRRTHLVRTWPSPRVEPPRAALHQRVWDVQSDGIVQALVVLEELAAPSGAVLALVTPPFCSVDGDAAAATTHGGATVRRDDLPDGRVRFLLESSAEAHRCAWSYRISNAFALTQQDIVRRDAGSFWRCAGLAPDEEGHSHIVRIACDKLSLQVRIAALPDCEPRVVVERREEHLGRDEWRVVEEEAQRCRVERSAHGFGFEVEAPLMQHRYTLAWRPPASPSQLSFEVEHATREVLARCHDEQTETLGLSRALGEALHAQMRSVLGGELSAHTSCVALLWSDERKRLFTAFGRFSHPAWNVRFASGDGVAGHAFRFARRAFWHRAHGATSALIFRERTELQGAYRRRYNWVLCFPIRSARGPVGVVSLAGDGVEGAAEQALDRLARVVLRGEARPDDRARIQDLQTAIDGAFWTVVSDAPGLSADTRRLADETLAALVDEKLEAP